LLQWWTNAYDYPWIISGKPFWSIPANVPIMFELTVLLSAVTTLVGMLLLNNLPEPSHPLDQVRRFARVTDDKFFLMIQASDRSSIRSRPRSARQHAPGGDRSRTGRPRHRGQAADRLGLRLDHRAVASVVPFALAAKAATRRARARASTSFRTWIRSRNTRRTRELFFADNRATRPAIEGTVAVGDARDDDHFYKGKEGGAWSRTFPSEIALTEATMDRGRQRSAFIARLATAKLAG